MQKFTQVTRWLRIAASNDVEADSCWHPPASSIMWWSTRAWNGARPLCSPTNYFFNNDPRDPHSSHPPAESQCDITSPRQEIPAHVSDSAVLKYESPAAPKPGQHPKTAPPSGKSNATIGRTRRTIANQTVGIAHCMRYQEASAATPTASHPKEGLDLYMDDVKKPAEVSTGFSGFQHVSDTREYV